MFVREVRPEEWERAANIVLQAYRDLPGYVSEPAYERELVDVAGRASAAVVAVALDPDVVGCVTYVPDQTNAFAEFDDPEACGFRMLAVDPLRQGGGAGGALVRWCIERARGEGRARVMIHSTPWMTRAHELYGRLGFVRRPDLDWLPVPNIRLLGFVLELSPRT